MNDASAAKRLTVQGVQGDRYSQVAQSVTLALGLQRHVWASAGSSVQTHTHTVIFLSHRLLIVREKYIRKEREGACLVHSSV